MLPSSLLPQDLADMVDRLGADVGVPPLEVLPLSYAYAVRTPDGKHLGVIALAPSDDDDAEPEPFYWPLDRDFNSGEPMGLSPR